MPKKAKKRGQRDGNIRLRNDGRYEARLRIGGGRRKSYFGRTRGEVRKKLADAIAKHDRGLPTMDDSLRLSDWLDDWLEHVVKPNRRPKTVVGYSSIIENHLKPELGHLTLTRLAPAHVRRLLADKKASGLSPRTVVHIHSCLRGALETAYRDELVARNVARMVSPPSVGKSEIESYDEDQALAFLEAVAGSRWEHLFTVVLALGLRKGEALGLQWGDCDFDGKRLRIRHSLQRVDGGLLLGPTKTHRSKRPLPMLPLVEKALKAERAYRAELRLLAGPDWNASDFVFVTRTGRPIEPRNVNRALTGSSPGAKDKKRATTGLLAKARKAAAEEGRALDLPDITVHGLRHSMVTLLRAKGIPDATIAQIAGHSRVSTTTDIYGKVLDSVVADALGTLDSALSSAR